MNKTIFFLLVTLLAAASAWADTTLFHETFGNNSGSARVWDDSYSVKSGVPEVYSGITGYTITNAKQSKNTVGSSGSGLMQTTQGTDASIIIGPLNVASYSDLQITYQWKAASIKGTYYTKAYYSTSANGTYNEMTGTGPAGATTFVGRSYSLPSAAQVSTLYLKIVFNTSNTQAVIDEVDLSGTGSAPASAPEAPTFSPASGATSTTDSPITVTMACATGGAAIHYTTDGTTPTTSSTQGTSVTFSTAGTHTLKAIAAKNGLTSSVATATYSITQASQGGGDLDGNYVLVTDASTLQAGDKLIIANSATEGSYYAISNTQKSGNRPATSVTITNDNGTLFITPTSSTEIYELVGSAGSWSFKAISDGSYYSNQYLNANGGSSNNKLEYTTTITTTSKASISIANSQATVIFGADHGYLRYNPNTQNNAPLFNCYSSSSTTGSLTSLYRLVTAPDLTVVTGIGNFKQVTPGTTVRLYLPDENEARVLHVENNGNGIVDAYIRDNTGAILLHGISPNRPLAFNQHLAGWINGQYATNANGVPQFIPDGELTNTAFLVIADPVTEDTTEPAEVTTATLGDHLADWVTISEMRMGDTGTPTLSNTFNLSGYTAPYAGALIDVSAIVGGNSTLYPVSENDVPVITHVIDPAQNFVIPGNDITNATVRLKRTLQAGVWAPITVPFDISGFNGTIMQYDHLEVGAPVTGPISNNTFDAGNMVFTEAYSILAGIPYLVKPEVTIETPTYTGVSLHTGEPVTMSAILGGNASSHAPRRAMSGDEVYSFTGVYSPTNTPSDGTVRILTSSGDVIVASGEQIDGTSAYITAPANQGVHITFDGTQEIITAVTDIHAPATPTKRIGIYNMMGVKMTVPWDDLPPGFYIVDGKKTIKTGKEVAK